MAEQKDKLERRSSKSRLSKQDEVEEVEEEDNSPSSEASDATIIPAGSETPVVRTPGGGSPESNSPDDKEKQLEHQESTDSNKDSPTQGGNPKVKLLVRSEALCEDASPPPEEGTGPATASATCNIASLSPTPQPKGYTKRRLEKDGSQSSTSDAGGISPCLSRDSSVEYTDSTGIDLEGFIKMTLNKNNKDRMMLLKLEGDLINFIKDSKHDRHDFLKFPTMSSYNRMLVHRVAAFFGLDHNVDPSGKCVIVNCTGSTRVPDFKFRDHIQETMTQEDQPKKQILKRESASFEEGRSPERHGLDKKSKSFEEREEEYKEARRRIFNQQDSASSQEGVIDSPASRTSTRQSSARSSKEDLRWPTEARPWSSTESGYSSSYSDTSIKVKVGVTKASSFGGVTVLSRGDSRSSTASKNHSLSSGASSCLTSPMSRPPTIPSSPPLDSQLSESGSSSQSAASPATASQSHGESPTPAITGLPFAVDTGQPMAVWVASSLDSIPPGSLIINPQTGQPYLNSDGTLYRFQPPPPPSSSSSLSSQQLPRPMAPPMPQPQAPVPVPQYPSMMPPQQPQPQHMYPPYPTTQEAGGGDMTQQFSALSLSQQSSTESMPDMSGLPPGAQSMYMVSPPQQQAVPQQMAPQQGYIQPQQVPYYAPTSRPAAAGPQVQYMYPTMPFMPTTQQGALQSQGSIEGQGQAQGQPPQPQQNGQYSSQPYMQGGYSSYQVMGGYPSMTVQGVEGYQTTYQQGAPLQPGYQAQQPAQQPQSQEMTIGSATIATSQGSYVQYPPGTSSQGSYIQSTPVPVYYTSATTSNGSQVLSYPMTGQPNAGSYRPRTPPSQPPSGAQPASMSAQGAAMSVTSPPYMSYAAYPQLSGQPPSGAPQRSLTPQMVPYTGMATQSPPQFPSAVVRPNMQMSMQMPTRTTTPPHGGVQYAPMPVLATGPTAQQQQQQQQHQQPQQLKIITMDQRGAKSTEMYNPEALSMAGGSKENGMGLVTTPGGHGQQVSAIPKVIPLPAAMPVRPATTTMPYRQPTPMNPGDMRLLGQPLQQQFAPPRPALQPLLVPRPRLPSPVNTQMSSSKTAAAKSRRWRTGNQGTSPHSSMETMGHVPILEITGLPLERGPGELEIICDDLIKQGARLQVLPPGEEQKPEGGATGLAPATDCIVLAIFDSEPLAQRALTSHRSTKYRLRAATRHYDPSTLQAPS